MEEFQHIYPMSGFGLAEVNQTPRTPRNQIQSGWGPSMTSLTSAGATTPLQWVTTVSSKKQHCRKNTSSSASFVPAALQFESSARCLQQEHFLVERNLSLSENSEVKAERARQLVALGGFIKGCCATTVCLHWALFIMWGQQRGWLCSYGCNVARNSEKSDVGPFTWGVRIALMSHYVVNQEVIILTQ